MSGLSTEIIAGIGAGTLGVALGFFFAKKKVAGKNEVSSRLVDALQTPHSRIDQTLTIETLLSAACQDFGADSAGLYSFEAGDMPSLRLTALCGETAFADEIRLGAGASGTAAARGQSLIVTRKRNHDLMGEEFADALQSAIAIPIWSNPSGPGTETPIEHPVAIATFASTRPDAFGPSALEHGSALATILAMQLGSEAILRFSRRTIVESLQEIADYLEAKNPLTAGHSRRVAEIAGHIAERMGLKDDLVLEVVEGAKLIDIGQVAIPDSVLYKLDKLTEEEIALVRTHSQVSYQICKKLNLPESVLLIVKHHHERLDGSGYPDGLQAGELPLPLRIVCVADAFDAMRCPRAHRAELSLDEAIGLLMKDAGTLYDPIVVEVLRELCQEGTVVGGIQQVQEVRWAA